MHAKFKKMSLKTFYLNKEERQSFPKYQQILKEKRNKGDIFIHLFIIEI